MTTDRAADLERAPTKENERPPVSATADAAVHRGVTPQSILSLQRTAGNAAVASMLAVRAPRRSVARFRSVGLVNPPPGGPQQVFFHSLLFIFVNDQVKEALFDQGESDWVVDWQVPKDARTVRIEAWVTGSAGAGSQFGGKVIARFNVEPDGTLTAVGGRPYPADQKVSGATTSFDGGIGDARPDSLTVSARAALDASTQVQSATGQTTGTTKGSSTQGSVSQTTSGSSTEETSEEDSNIVGRGIREVPYGDVLVGKPDTKKGSTTSGSSTTIGGTSGTNTTEQRQDNTSKTTTGPGTANTNVVQQTVSVHVRSPLRDAPGTWVEIKDFGVGSAKIEEKHLEVLLDFLQQGAEPTNLERLKNGHAKIQLYGYASKPGSRDVNQTVATDRMAAVKRYLMGKSVGIPADMERRLSSGARRFGAFALLVDRVWSAGWVAVRQCWCATRGQADIRGSCGRRTVDSSWGAAV